VARPRKTPNLGKGRLTILAWLLVGEGNGKEKGREKDDLLYVTLFWRERYPATFLPRRSKSSFLEWREPSTLILASIFHLQYTSKKVAKCYVIF